MSFSYQMFHLGQWKDNAQWQMKQLTKHKKKKVQKLSMA